MIMEDATASEGSKAAGDAASDHGATAIIEVSGESNRRKFKDDSDSGRDTSRDNPELGSGDSAATNEQQAAVDDVQGSASLAEHQNTKSNLRGSGDKSAAAQAAREAAAAAAEAVSAAETAAAAAWGKTTSNKSISSHSNSRKNHAPADIRSLLFPNWNGIDTADDSEGTQVFIENDGSIRLNVHQHRNSRTGRRRRQMQQVLGYDEGLFGGDEELFPSLSEQQLHLPSRIAAAPRGSSGEAALAMEELMLLERLREAGVHTSLRAHLEEALQQQVHSLGSTESIGSSFIDTNPGDSSGGVNKGGLYGYLAAFGIGFGGILLISIIICCVRAAYVKHMKKKLEAQLAALNATPEEQEEAEKKEEMSEQGWVDVSVQEHKPQATEEIKALASRASLQPPPAATDGAEKKDKSKKEKKEKKEKKKKKKSKREDGSLAEKSEGESKSSKQKRKEKQEKELKKVLSSRRTLKL